MRFDLSRAWNDAVAAITANREVLMVVAGVFFLLPSLVFSFLFADVQTSMMENFQKVAENKMAAEAMMNSVPASAIATSVVLVLVQLVGYMALLALLDARGRPTVGEALVIGAKSLPTLLGTVVMFGLGYLLAIVLVSMIATAVTTLLGLGALAALLMVLFLVALVYVMVKLSITLPVIVFERQLNPLAAMARSWRLTKGNSLRLFGFYVLLFIAYLAISIVVSGIFMVALGALTSGTLGLMIVGLASGVLAAVVNMVFAGVLTGVYRQFAGPSTAGLDQTFG